MKAAAFDDTVVTHIPTPGAVSGGRAWRNISCLIALLPALLFLPALLASARAQGEPDAVTLEVGKPVEREMSAGMTHSYRLALSAGQLADIFVDQRGIDVVVALFGPDGKKLTEIDGPTGRGGSERLSIIVETPGNYRLEVSAFEKGAPAGRYVARFAELRAATPADRLLVEALRLLYESAALENKGQLDEAIKSAEQAVALREQALGPGHLDVASALNQFARLCDEKGDYAKAASAHQRALAIREKRLGPDHPTTVVSAHNLALVYKTQGDYAQAEPLFRRALPVIEKAGGANHPDVANAADNLAAVYLQMGDYARAEPLFQRALAIREKVRGPDHPAVAYSLNNLATLYDRLGQYAKAVELHQRALAIKEKRFGTGHPEVALSLNNLARLRANQGDNEQAKQLYQRALAILEKKPGAADLDLAHSLNDLAVLYQGEGNYAQAEPFYHRSLAIWEKLLGPEHALVARSLVNLFSLHRERNDPQPAVSFLARANEISERDISRNLLAGSERQKLAYLELFPRQINNAIELHLQLAPGDPPAIRLALTTLLRRKGRTLDAMTDIIARLRRHTDAQSQVLFDQLAAARSQLAALTIRGPNPSDPARFRAQVGQLEERMEKIEGEISDRSAEFKSSFQPVTLANVQAALPKGSVLVEFALYAPFNSQTRSFGSARYVAYALASDGLPRWADLGKAAEIDREVDDLRRALRTPGRAEVKRLARRVDEKLMRPVRALLGGAQRVFISPEGSLNLIPFAALIDERGRYLVERYSFSYLTSGRDLLRLQATAESKSQPLIVADPEFGDIASATKQSDRGLGLQANNEQNAAALPGLPRVSFRPLPGTAGEAQALLRILPQARMLTKRQATETAIKQISSPSILHIATHGFFLKEAEAKPDQTRGLGLSGADAAAISNRASSDNPLLRSGLVLAGANERRSDNDDGIMTALEVAGLDLWGTKLVVLSACNTGVGEVKRGEGVYGLRRALVLAGAETQVISLWPVPDKGTRDLMVAYYRALQRGEGRSDALRHVQLRMLRSKGRQHPYYWASFIQSGEWKPLEGIGARRFKTITSQQKSR